MSHVHVPHLPHLPNWRRSPGDGHLRRDVLIAAEVALATLIIGVEGRRLVARFTPTDPVPPSATAVQQLATAAASPVVLTPTIAVTTAGDDALVRLTLPTAGAAVVSVVDAHGSVVATLPDGAASTTLDHVAPGRYRVVVDHHGAVERVGDTMVSSAITVGSATIDLAHDGTITLVTTDGR